MPGRSSPRLSISSPRDTIRRFSSHSGMTSATVPMATRSMNRRLMASNTSTALPPVRACSQAQISLKATPTPANSRKGYGQSGRCGLTTATQSGRASRHSW